MSALSPAGATFRLTLVSSYEISQFCVRVPRSWYKWCSPPWHLARREKEKTFCFFPQLWLELSTLPCTTIDPDPHFLPFQLNPTRAGYFNSWYEEDIGTFLEHNWNIFGYIWYLYMGLVALSLNQRIRKTSPQPEEDWTSQGSTAVVPWSPFTCETGTGRQKVLQLWWQ